MTLLLLALLGVAGRPAPDAPIPETARVVSVYDGDTVTLDNGDKVRLRWVNTPERRPPEAYADEAKHLTERIVLGREVRLLVQEGETRDGYGRLLAGLQTDRYNLSIRLLEEGYGHLFIIPPEDTDMAPFLAAQQSARDALRGIWSTDRYQGALHITSFHADARGPDEQNVNGEYMRVCNVTTGPVDLLGFTLVADGRQRFELPHMVLPPGHTVLIHSGHGVHQTDPASQMHVYLGLPRPLWDNDRAEAVIVGPGDRVVDRVLHQVKARK